MAKAHAIKTVTELTLTLSEEFYDVGLRPVSDDEEGRNA